MSRRKLYLAVHFREPDDLTFSCNLQSAAILSVYFFLDCWQQVQLMLYESDDPGDFFFFFDLKKLVKLPIVRLKELPQIISDCRLPVFIKYENFLACGIGPILRQLVKSKGKEFLNLLGFRESTLSSVAEMSCLTKLCEIDIVESYNTFFSEYKQQRCKMPEPIFLTHIEKVLSLPPVIHNNKKGKKVTCKRLYLEGQCFTVCDIFCFFPVNSLFMALKFNFSEYAPRTFVWYQSLYKIQKQRDEELRKITLETQKKLGLDVLKNVCSGESVIGPYLCTFGDEVIEGSGDFFNPEREQELLSNVSKMITEPEKAITSTVNDCMENAPRRSKKKEKRIRNASRTENVMNKIFDLHFENEIVVQPKDVDYINWKEIPFLATPAGGQLPENRVQRKNVQVKHVVARVMQLQVLQKKNAVIVDFCSGVGHTGILLAYLLPHCHVILVDFREQALEIAKKRIDGLQLKNVDIIMSNVTYFQGKFDVGVALHPCGVSADLVINKCLQQNADFVVVPCCYGKIHDMHHLSYPASNMYKLGGVTKTDFQILVQCADNTHEDHKDLYRGERCMDYVDIDRCLSVKQNGYDAYLTKMVPLTCTPKHNIIVASKISLSH